MFSSNTSQVSSDATYIEDVFSTYLYTGLLDPVNLTINNGVDLATYGGMVWQKRRDNAGNNFINDSARGKTGSKYNRLVTNLIDAQVTNPSTWITSFNTNGFTLNDDGNTSGYTFASWTFRKQPKFFDVVTYTGNGATNQWVNHALGSNPGCVIIKKTSNTGNWCVFHGHGGVISTDQVSFLNLSNAEETFNDGFSATSTQLGIPRISSTVSGTSMSLNDSGQTYVAYLFAHNAGGFGLTGTDNVISCGSYTGGGTPEVNLGWEPQWVLVKQATGASSAWYLVDSMRTFPYSGSSNALMPNLSNVENGWFNANFIVPTATGFKITYPAGSGTEINDTGQTYIYIAIRRGPMKTPTSGTSVFSPNTSAAYNVPVTTNFPIDLQMWAVRTGNGNNFSTVDRLRGVSSTSLSVDNRLVTSNANGELVGIADGSLAWNNTGYNPVTSASLIAHNFRRAPGFFDEVCYTGNDTAGATQAHNLGVAPELMIVKRRNQADGWFCYHSALGATKTIILNDYQPAVTTSAIWNNTAPSASVFTLGWDSAVNGSGSTYVAYLFATVAGVSKVGSYTGTGTTQQINCGFTAGARFVLIKRTNGSGDSADGWYVWDSARGIVAGNDPYLLLNSTAAEVTNTDYVDTYSAGFEISSTAPAAINASGGSFIYLAIA